MRPTVLVLVALVLLGCVPANAKASRKLLDGDVKSSGQPGQADAAAQAAVQAVVAATQQALSAWGARAGSGSFGAKAGRFFTDLSTRITARQGYTSAPGLPLTLSLADYGDEVLTIVSNDYLQDPPPPVGDTCRVAADGTLLVRTTTVAFIKGPAAATKPCDLRLEGFDAQADLLPGGLDGTYRLTGCLNGAPLFSRAGADSSGAADRWLFFSAAYGDWSLARGERPNEDDILLFGSAAMADPLSVTDWQVGVDLVSAVAGEHSRRVPEYVPAAPGARVSCAGPAERAARAVEGVMIEGGAASSAAVEGYAEYYDAADEVPEVLTM